MMKLWLRKMFDDSQCSVVSVSWWWWWSRWHSQVMSCLLLLPTLNNCIAGPLGGMSWMIIFKKIESVSLDPSIFSLVICSSQTMIVVVYLILFPSQSILKCFLTFGENWNNYHQSASSWSNKSWQSINRKLKIVQHWTDCQFSTKQVIFVNTNNIVEFSMLTFALWSHVVDTLKLSTGLNKFHNFNFFVGRPAGAPGV